MRRLFIILMIALLPLRSWAGDVMTVEMAVGQLTNSARATTQMVAECHGQNVETFTVGSETSNENEAAKSSTDSITDGRCDTCGTCQLCHSVALANFSFSELLSLMAPTLLSSYSTGFASALRALSLKPPIS